MNRAKSAVARTVCFAALTAVVTVTALAIPRAHTRPAPETTTVRVVQSPWAVTVPAAPITAR